MAETNDIRARKSAAASTRTYTGRPTRPRRATVAAIMLAVRGAGGVTISGLLLLALRDDSDRHHQFVSGTLHAVLYLELALSCLQILAGLGVWQGEKWGRGPAVALCVIDLLAEAFSLGLGYGIGVSLTLGLVTVQEAAAAISVDVSVLRMLDNPDVKRWGG